MHLIPEIFFGAFYLVMAASGFKKGLISGLFSYLALIIGIFAAIKIPNENYYGIETLQDSPLTAYFVIFFAIYLTVVFMGKAITKVLETISLGLFNKILGMALGILKASVIYTFIIIFLASIRLPDKIVNSLAGSKAFRADLEISMEYVAAFSSKSPEKSGLLLKNLDELNQKIVAKTESQNI